MNEKPQRKPLNHERSIIYRSFEREDGLFDIEGRLHDSKGYLYNDRERGLLQPGEPVHHVLALLTIDTDMVVRDFDYEFVSAPFSYCLGAVDPKRMVGVSIKKQWRQSVAEAFGPIGGCTHLREMIVGMGTVAYQTLSALRDQRMIENGGGDADFTEPPFFLGGCHSWAWDSPVVETYFPQFHDKDGRKAE